MGGQLGATHGGSDGGFLEEAVEELFGGVVRGLLEVHGIKGFTKKMLDMSSICVKFHFF